MIETIKKLIVPIVALLAVIAGIVLLLKFNNGIKDFDLIPERSREVILTRNISKEDPLTQIYASEPDTVYVWNPDTNQQVAKIQLADTTAQFFNVSDYQLSNSRVYYFDYNDRIVKAVDYSGSVSNLDFTKPSEGNSSIPFLLSPDDDQIAWFDYQFSEDNSVSRLWVANIDGTNKRMAYEKSFDAPRVLRPHRWDNDRFYFAEYPDGIGGYILFYGPNNLWSIDLNAENSQPTEVIVLEPASESITQFQDISKDGKFVLYTQGLFNEESLYIKNLETDQTESVEIGRDEDFRAGGNAKFSPDGKYVVYNEAAWTPDAEHVRAISLNLKTKEKKVLFDNYNEQAMVRQWVSNNKIMLQSAGTTYFVDKDGSDLIIANLPAPEGWSTYTNTQYGFSVEHPSNFQPVGRASTNSVLGDNDNHEPGIIIGPLLLVVADTEELRLEAAGYINNYLSHAQRPPLPVDGPTIDCNIFSIPNMHKMDYVYCTGEGGPASYGLIHTPDYDIFVDGYSGGFGDAEQSMRSIDQTVVQKIMASFKDESQTKNIIVREEPEEINISKFKNALSIGPTHRDQERGIAFKYPDFLQLNSVSSGEPYYYQFRVKKDLRIEGTTRADDVLLTGDVFLQVEIWPGRQPNGCFDLNSGGLTYSNISPKFLIDGIEYTGCNGTGDVFRLEVLRGNRLYVFSNWIFHKTAFGGDNDMALRALLSAIDFIE